MKVAETIIGFLADTATLLLAAATVAVTLLRRSEAFRRWSLGLPLRHAIRQSAGGTSTVADLAELLNVPPRLGAVVAALQAPSLRVLDGEDLTPGDAIAELVLAGRGEVSSANSGAALLGAVYGKSVRGSNASLLSRVLYPEEVSRVTEFHGNMVRALAPFAQATAVTPTRSHATPGQGSSFPGFVTALSGAAVLVDASAIRSRHADGVLIWHRRHYRDAQGEVCNGGYSELHDTGFCQFWQPEAQLPGDFDRKMLDLRSVALVESSAEGSIKFALGTWETCYAATEQGDAHGCKKVPVDPGKVDAALDPIFSRKAHELLQPTQSRLTLLTSYVSVLTSDGFLALIQRSRSVRNGAGVVSATAGGIVEIDAPGPSGDVSALGTPDSTVTASREAAEEIGLDLPPECIKPVAVFLANARERTVTPGGRGQLVGVVLNLARTDQTLDQLRRGGDARSDMSRGRFEWDEFVACPTNSVHAMASWARMAAPDLDQHGLLSVVYSAMTLYGPAATRSAFEHAFLEGPWWCGPAAGSALYRVCRDPGPLAGTTTQRLLSDVSSDWAETWMQCIDRAMLAATRAERAGSAPTHRSGSAGQSMRP